MNFRKVSKYSLLFLLGLSSWVPVLVINIIYWLQNTYAGSVHFQAPFTEEVRSGFFAIFVIANYFLVGQLIRQIEKWDVIDLLWKLLVIGISGISLTFLFQILEEYMLDQSIYAYVKALSASINLYAMLLFALSTIFIFKKLILYQKNRRKIVSWNILQGVFLLGILRLFLGLHGSSMNPGDLNTSFFSIDATGIYTSVVLPVFLGISLFLSGNVNWSAYLNFNQKLKSLFLLFIIILLFIAFFLKFPFDAMPDTGAPFDLMTRKHLVFGLIYLFPFIYALIAGLVLIFNLQTSSVFEQRSIELATINRINQSIQANLDTEEILRTLLDGSLLISNASGGWIETFSSNENEQSEGVSDSQNVVDWWGGQNPAGKEHFKRQISYSKNVNRDQAASLRSQVDLTKEVLESGKHIYIKNLKKHKNFRETKTKIRSLLALPIQTSQKPIGVIYLVNELAASFEDESIVSLVSLTEQSGISIENAELVSRSIGLEIYREQLKIAKTFQKQILPQTLPGTDKIEFSVMTQEVEEIGGDFYDVAYSDETYKIAVGDVSGKGTTAAFYMAETKGIFQALTQLDIGVRDFILNANMALSNCLRKGSFMTLTYVNIHMDKQEIELLRAGHCETLFYDSQKDELLVLEEGSPGLGIIRKPSFQNFVPEPEVFSFNPEDLLILFTDGIVEAHNKDHEEFGLERLKEIAFRLRKADSNVIAETLVKQAKAFTGGQIDDDYSILVIKFL